MPDPSRPSRDNRINVRSDLKQQMESAPTPAPAAGKPEPVGPSADLSNEEIARQAYNRWESSDRAHGRDQEHWFAAEEELRRRGGRQSTGTTPTDLAQGERDDF